MEGGPAFIPSDILKVPDQTLPRIPRALEALGMGTPIARFFGFSLLSAALLYYGKPGPFFTKAGDAKPWALFTMGRPGKDGVRSTAVPWYLVAILIGFGAATFL